MTDRTELLAQLDRAHRMSSAAPDAETLYSRAASSLREAEAEVKAAWGQESRMHRERDEAEDHLDTIGSLAPRSYPPLAQYMEMLGKLDAILEGEEVDDD